MSACLGPALSALYRFPKLVMVNRQRSGLLTARIPRWRRFAVWRDRIQSFGSSDDLPAKLVDPRTRESSTSRAGRVVRVLRQSRHLAQLRPQAAQVSIRMQEEEEFRKRLRRGRPQAARDTAG